MSIDTGISTIMTRDVVSVDPETTIPEIARLLWENQISGVPVVESGRVVGMVTEYDLISQQSEYEAPMYLSILSSYVRMPGTGDPEQLRRILATTARELMTHPVITVPVDATIQDVATIMYEERLNAIPVVSERDGALAGIVSRADVVRLMALESTFSEQASSEE